MLSSQARLLSLLQCNVMAFPVPRRRLLMGCFAASADDLPVYLLVFIIETHALASQYLLNH